MESFSLPGSQPLPPSSEEPVGVEAQLLETLLNIICLLQLFLKKEKKKRKGVESRSKVWDHFEKILNNEGILIKGERLYCAKLFACEFKKHGTPLRNHMLSCLKKLTLRIHHTRHYLLSFQSVYASPKTNKGILGFWVFN